MSDTKKFFLFVIPSVLSFALSGVYSIVDGYFVGNSIGDLGLSAVTIAYPIVAVIQALGTGIGMGGAVYYSISRASKDETRAKEFAAGALQLMIVSSILLTTGIYFGGAALLRLFGAGGELLKYANEYVVCIALGAGPQILGTGLVPFIRNNGGSFCAMAAMVAGFLTNILLDYLFVWVFPWGMAGAAAATVIGQGVTMLAAVVYLARAKQIFLSLPVRRCAAVFAPVMKTGAASFGLTMSPNVSLMIVNRFSANYGGEPALAAYACIAYAVCIVYMLFQGVGDGAQPLLSDCWGGRDFARLRRFRRLAYGSASALALFGCVLMLAARGALGPLFGASASVSADIARALPIFLISVPFDAFCRVTTASFYATEKSGFSYLLTLAEPILMLPLMLLLPPLFGGQLMVWWSVSIAKVFAAALAVVLKLRADKEEALYCVSS